LKLIQGDIEPASGRSPLAVFDHRAELSGDSGPGSPTLEPLGHISGTIMENLTVFSPEKRDFARKMSQLLGLETTINLLRMGTKRCSRASVTIADVRSQVNIVRALTNRPVWLALDEANMVLTQSLSPR